MAEIVLQRSRVVAVVGELVSARMAKHVRVDVEGHAGSPAKALDEAVKADAVHRPATLGLFVHREQELSERGTAHFHGRVANHGSGRAPEGG